MQKLVDTRQTQTRTDCSSRFARSMHNPSGADGSIFFFLSQHRKHHVFIDDFSKTQFRGVQQNFGTSYLFHEIMKYFFSHTILNHLLSYKISEHLFFPQNFGTSFPS